MTRGRFARFDDYDFTHFVRRHLDDPTPESLDVLHRALALLDADGRHSWFAARQARHEVAACSADVDAVRDFVGNQVRTGESSSTPSADSAGSTDSFRADPRTVAVLARYALLSAVLVDRADALPPALADALVACGAWTRQDAVDWARLSPGSQASLEILRSAVRAEGAARRPDLVEAVLNAVSAIGSTDDRAILIADLLADLPPGSERLAVSLLLLVDNEGGRSAGIGGFLDRVRDRLTEDRAAAMVEELIDSFRQPDLRARVAAMAASRCGGEVRRRWFDRALDAARTTARIGNAERVPALSAHVLEEIARYGPLDLVTALCDEFENGAFLVDGNGPALRDAFLARRAEVDPYAVSTVVGELEHPSWQLTAKLALSLAARGNHDEALDLAEHRIGGYAASELLRGLLALVPPAYFPRIVSLAIRLGSAEWSGPVLAELARDPERLVQGLDQAAVLGLARTADDPKVAVEVRARLGAVLDDGAFAELVDDLESTEDQVGDLWAAVAWRLDLEGVRRGLTVGASWITSRDVIALLARLVALDAAHEAIRWLGDTGTGRSLHGEEIVAALAPLVRPDLVPALARTMAPRTVLLERVLARCALAGRLPVARVREIIADADLLEADDRLECLRDLAESVRGHPEIEAGRRVAEALALVLCIVPAGSRQQADAVVDALDTLHEFHATGWYVDTFDGTAHTRIRDESLRLGLRLAWLAALASRAGAARLPVLAVTAAQVVGDNPGAAEWLLARSRPSWRRQVLDALLGQPLDALLGQPLVTVARLLPGLADHLVPSDAAVLVDRLAAANDVNLRLTILGNVAEFLDTGSRTTWAAKEFARLPEAIGPGSASFLHEKLTRLDPKVGPAVRQRFTAEVYETPQDLALLVTRDQRAAEGAVRWLARHPDDLRHGPRLRRELFVRAIANGDVALARVALPPQDYVAFDDVFEGLIAQMPSAWLRLVADSFGGFGPTDRLRRQLAARAAELGEIDIAATALGSMTFYREEDVAEAYGRASPAGRAGLLRVVRRLPGRQQLPTLAAMAARSEPSVAAHLASEVMVAVREVDHDARRAPLRSLAKGSLPVHRALEAWSALLCDTGRATRSEVLLDIREAAPMLLSHLGDDFALALDDELVLGSGERWAWTAEPGRFAPD